jgi:hypothetical protein
MTDDPKPPPPFYVPRRYYQPPRPIPCLHLACPRCHGTGRTYEGAMCLHAISCPCPRCTPRCM